MRPTNFRRSWLSLAAAVLFAVAPAHADTRLIVRALGGLPLLQSACNLLGCHVQYGLGDPLDQVFLITTPNLLTGNLLLIVMLAGYENFVSKIHINQHEDRPSWMGTVDFSNLKIKLIASIVAISAIALLRAFLPLGDSSEPVDPARLRWMVSIHLTFVVSGLMLAAMDWVTSRTIPHAASRG